MIKKLIYRTLAAGAVLLFLGACSVFAPSVSKEQIEQARGLSYTLETGYLLALQEGTVWARPANRCGLPKALPKPACSTAQGVLAAEARRLDARTALDHLTVVIADARSTPDAISVAMSAARNAMAAYQDISKGGA